VPVQVYNPNTGTYTTTLVQQSNPYGTTNPYSGGQPCGAAPLTAQQAPYGVGTNGAACTVPPQIPQCAQGATPMPIYGYGNGCVTNYQCVPPPGSTLGQTPTPQISCSPQIADVGSSVAISYSCQNATGSSGSGFSTGNQLSGSANATMQSPPAGTNTANFGLTCTGSGQTASAQCSVQINKAAIVLVANPQSVTSGGTASIGWVTSGMQSCVISSPQDSAFTQQNANKTNVNGVAQTDPITQSTEFDLTCQTLGGQTKTASTIVSVGSSNSNQGSVTVSSTADAKTINHGGTVTITWSSTSTASNSAVALWLIDLHTEQASALIADGQSLTGTYQWSVPNVGDPCNSSSNQVCASNLVAGSSYGIQAALYTPQNAYFGTGQPPSGSVAPTYLGYGYTPNPFTIGQ
jgi:hypothetical protein